MPSFTSAFHFTIYTCAISECRCILIFDSFASFFFFALVIFLFLVRWLYAFLHFSYAACTLHDRNKNEWADSSRRKNEKENEARKKVRTQEAHRLGKSETENEKRRKKIKTESFIMFSIFFKVMCCRCCGRRRHFSFQCIYVNGIGSVIDALVLFEFHKNRKKNKKSKTRTEQNTKMKNTHITQPSYWAIGCTQ